MVTFPISLFPDGKLSRFHIPISQMKKPECMLSDLPEITRPDNKQIAPAMREPLIDLMGSTPSARNIKHPSLSPHLQFDEMMYGEDSSNCKGFLKIGPTPCR